MCIHEWKEGLTVVFSVRVFHSFCKHEASCLVMLTTHARRVLYQCNALQNSSFSFSLELVCNMMKPISGQRLVSSSFEWNVGRISRLDFHFILKSFTDLVPIICYEQQGNLHLIPSASASHNIRLQSFIFTAVPLYLPGYFQVEFIWNIPRRCSEYWAWWQSKNDMKLSKIMYESIGVMIVK
jgi:hypothetical protein